MIFLVLLFSFQDGVTLYPVEDTFQVISPSKIAVSSDGEVYCIDDANQVLRFASDGSLVSRFAGRGEGPGELTGPMKMGFSGDRLWIYDFSLARIQWYDREGRFVESFRHKKLNPTLAKTPRGWVMLEHLYGSNGPARLVHLSDDLSQEETLSEWQPAFQHPVKAREREEKRVAYNPAREQIFFRVSTDGTTAWIISPGPRLALQEWDLEKRALVSTIKRPEKPPEFNRSWGREKIRGQSGHFEIVLDAPDAFPIVKGFAVTPENKLVLGLWTNEPDEISRHVVINSQGKDEALSYDPAQVGRVFHKLGKDYYLTGFDVETDRAVIVKCKQGEIDDMLVSYPTIEPKNRGVWVPIQ
jgi:hypothetical protein